MKPLFFVIISILLFVSFSGALGEYEVSKEINWKKGTLDINISRDIDITREYRPNLRFIGEKKIEDDFYALFYNLILDINVDSYQTIGSLLKDNRELNKRLIQVIENRKKGLSRITGQWARLNVPYSCSLFGEEGLISIFVDHIYPDPLIRKLGFVPSRPYSGLVVYVKGTFGVMNEKKEGTLVPVLFPDFYDDQMNLIFSKKNCDPGAIKKWGMVSYTEQDDLTAALPRIGDFPLKTIAYAIYGEHYSDIVLSRDVADKLLSSEENRRLLKEGRILIICDLSL